MLVLGRSLGVAAQRDEVHCEPGLEDAAGGHDGIDHDVVVQWCSGCQRDQFWSILQHSWCGQSKICQMRGEYSAYGKPVWSGCPSSVVSKSPNHTETLAIYSNCSLYLGFRMRKCFCDVKGIITWWARQVNFETTYVGYPLRMMMT